MPGFSRSAFNPNVGNHGFPLASDLCKSDIEGIVITPLEVSPYDSFPLMYQQLERVIESERPDAVFPISLSHRGETMRLEKTALNEHRLGYIGSMLKTRRLLQEGPKRLVSGFPAERLTQKPCLVSERGKDYTYPVEVHHHAGFFGCNALLYAALHIIQSMQQVMDVMLLHVPYTERMKREHVPYRHQVVAMKQILERYRDMK